jgi:hypothetical protein
MTSHSCRSKRTAKEYAEEAREKGFSASVHKKKKGYGVSVTRKK